MFEVLDAVGFEEDEQDERPQSEDEAVRRVPVLLLGFLCGTESLKNLQPPPRTTRTDNFSRSYSHVMALRVYIILLNHHPITHASAGVHLYANAAERFTL